MTLIEHLSVVKETRADINRQYDLIDVIFLVVSAIKGLVVLKSNLSPFDWLG
ncbi:hypothetical protein ID852_01350 [Xenorhabdus sp. 42]|uniref:hypothetical protein n=1 Tax=Xenorhabdus szentirmaii TaxID=290112 RepID=UPI0019AE16CD|nr:hypothetical protein [Xenorhabdus sp. 42]MBD2819361.1 hypothetical protein [Xenorhabdus sp. 42]